MIFGRTQSAIQTPFTPEAGFVSTDVQAAIIEAKNNVLGVTRFTILLTNNGSFTNGQWVGYTELLPGNNTPIIFPRACSIKEVSFTNTNVNIQGKFDFRRGLITNPIYRTWTINSGASTKYQNLTGIDDAFAAGEPVFIQWTKTAGNTPSDIALILYVQNS